MKKTIALLAGLGILASGMSVFAAETDTVNVTFNDNYEGGSVITSPVAADSEIVASNPLRYGYTHTGWYLDAECTQPVEDMTASEDVELYSGWEEWSEETKANMDMTLEEFSLSREIMGAKPAYDDETYSAFSDAYWLMYNRVVDDRAVVDNDDILAYVEDVREKREKVIQIADPDDYKWYIWEEGNMPVEEGELNFYYTFDDEGFKPFLVPYVLENQEEVKGNIIVIAGGGFAARCNEIEAYPVAEHFNTLGYNAFVLQRRVTPYAPIDSSLDLQRSIRYLRYHAEDLGIAKTENMVAAGFSGGGLTILNTVATWYGDLQPADEYPNYTADEIDQINSDLSAMLIIYGAMGPLETKNPNIPATFVTVGADDFMALPGCLSFFTALDGVVTNREMHVFSGTPHGFGTAERFDGYWNSGGYTGTDTWMDQAGTFLDVTFGYLGRTYE